MLHHMVVTTADGVELWWELRGDGPPVLLIPGRGDPSDLFPREFVDALAASGLSVLRWDPRDTGLSGDGGDRYDATTIADDSMLVLDAAGFDGAHIVGVSMAGLVMAALAERHPTRVRSLTFISAMSPDPEAGMGDDFFGAPDIDPSDRVAALVHAMGVTTEADREWAASAVAAGDLRAPHRPDAVARHQEAAFRMAWPTLDPLQRLTVPTLVVHGGRDRVLPVAHAHALGAAMPHASVHVIEDMGHIPRLGDWLTAAGLTATQAAPAD